MPSHEKIKKKMEDEAVQVQQGEEEESTAKITVERLLDLAKNVNLAREDLLGSNRSALLGNITQLDLPKCGLSSLPDDLPTALPNLSIMFLSGNEFRQMPAVIGRCPKLQMVAFRDNGMESIHPDALQSQLRWLILTDNHLESLPDTIGRCRSMQKLMLSGNRLRALPETISNCTNLELIRLASNTLAEPPMQLLLLPNLCWVGLSDNPFLPRTAAGKDGAEGTATSPSLPILHDVDENGGEILGQGAGGITRKVEYRGQTVAVKHFKEGGITSDGWPEEERAISCVVSDVNCPYLGAKVYGQTPCGTSLVMEYLDHVEALGNPPDFETCSRDVYPENLSLTRQEAGKVLSGLLDALMHLHKVGICHGDFYAHNILINKNDPSKARLTDFGAAFRYDATQPYGKALQRIELRAFAVLVEEVATKLVDCQITSEVLLSKYLSTCREEEARLDRVHSWWQEEQHLTFANAAEPL